MSRFGFTSENVDLSNVGGSHVVLAQYVVIEAPMDPAVGPDGAVGQSLDALEVLSWDDVLASLSDLPLVGMMAGRGPCSSFGGEVALRHQATEAIMDRALAAQKAAMDTLGEEFDAEDLSLSWDKIANALLACLEWPSAASGNGESVGYLSSRLRLLLLGLVPQLSAAHQSLLLQRLAVCLRKSPRVAAACERFLPFLQ